MERIKYRFGPFSQREREFWEEMVIEEVDLQAWYAVTCSTILGEEILIGVQ